MSKVEEIIPEALKQNVAVKTFPDLNALILSGDRRDVARVETFLRSVDKPVPMVTMEILIADVTKSRIHEIGLGAGVGDKAVKTSGTLSPGVEMTFGANAVNDLLGRIRGTVNLGRVTPNFYLSLQALEEDGVVRLLSTPKLSTLNGHEATLTSGETQYYKEVQNNYYGTQNPISSESYQWKSVDANLSIKVTPYMSEDRQITLEIEFEQTEFTDRNVEDAPPGTARGASSRSSRCRTRRWYSWAAWTATRWRTPRAVCRSWRACPSSSGSSARRSATRSNVRSISSSNPRS